MEANKMTDVVKLANLGWHLVPIESGTKNPGTIVGSGWPEKASNDTAQIQAWASANPNCNWGLLLGPKSGMIDLEFDSETGEMLVESWMEDAGNPQTPTYRSAKSVHRLFAWDDKFSCEGAKFGLCGVEFRFGQDKAQSVIPPSMHETGVQYEWIIPPTVPLAPLPEVIYKNFLNMKLTAEKTTAKAAAINPRYTSGDSLLTKARNYVEQNFVWGRFAGWRWLDFLSKSSGRSRLVASGKIERLNQRNGELWRIENSASVHHFGKPIRARFVI
jgi:hypothetical protein